MDKRIYCVSADIKESEIQNFYDKRAARYQELGDRAVLLGDSNPDAAIAHNKFESEVILPKLNLSSASRFLDIGCGAGRIAETVIPCVGYYCGTDLSEGMVKTAKSRCNALSGKFDFFNFTLSQTTEKLGKVYGRTFDVVFSSGVFMYINDSELQKGIESLLELLSDNCICYFENTVAISQRLTLNEFPSESLGDNYSAIYRTCKEYSELYRPLMKAGFHVLEEKLIVPSGSEGQLSETERSYIIIKRGK